MHHFETQASAIYQQSFSIIRAEAAADLARFDPMDEENVAVRMIHAAGLIVLARDIIFSPNMAKIARTALQNGAPIICDAQMVAHGITKSRLPANNKIICTIGEAQTAKIAHDLQTTRSAAAVHLWRADLQNAIVAIGNAPTALFELLNLFKNPDYPRPAAIIGCPVGFVGAAESKEALLADLPAPSLIVRGRLGGSAITAAAINALASKAE